MIVFAVLLAGLFFGFMVLPVGLLSLWLAISPMPLVLRFPLFLATTIPVAGCFGMMPAGGTAVGYLFVFLIAMAFFAMSDLGWRILGVGALTINLAMMAVAIMTGQFATEWFGWTAIGCSLVATLVGSLRVFGLRLVSLIDPHLGESIELVSGRTADGWLDYFDQAGADRWSFADLMIDLRVHGLTYQDQKAIAIMYEKSIGRRHAIRSMDGRDRAIVSSVGNVSELMPNDHRFGIKHLLQWSVAAAMAFAYAKAFLPTWIDMEQLFLGTVVCVAVSIVTIAVVTSTLMLRVPTRRHWIAGVIVVAVGVSLQNVASFYPGYRSVWFTGLISSIGYAGWLTLAMTLVRGRGYRLVRLRGNVALTRRGRAEPQSGSQRV